MTVVLFIALGAALVLLPYLFTAGSEGRFRRGVGWYFDARSSRDLLMKQRSGGAEAHQQGAPARKTHVWLVSGLGLLGLAVVTSVPVGIYSLSVIIGLFGVLYVLRALQAMRENRWLRGP
jgi:hypothetical protein